MHPAEIYHEPASDRREFPRYVAERSFRLHINIGDDVSRCRMTDISLGGARLEFERQPDEEMAAAVNFDWPEIGAFSAERCWQDGNAIGVRFDFSAEALDFVSHCLSSPDYLWRAGQQARLALV
jgi:hypothetical protein